MQQSEFVTQRETGCVVPVSTLSDQTAFTGLTIHGVNIAGKTIKLSPFVTDRKTRTLWY